ncbi:MAG: hypothetical protein L3J67_12670, partial [Hyphomicrobiaceae bacterium]|nr:hypothetical protein [Hyphomicrobiaceae bacterium]
MKIQIDRSLFVDIVGSIFLFGILIYLYVSVGTGNFGYLSAATATALGCFVLSITIVISFKRALQGVTSVYVSYFIRYMSWLLGPIFFMSSFFGITSVFFNSHWLTMGDLSDGFFLGLILMSVVSIWDLSYFFFWFFFSKIGVSESEERAKVYSYAMLLALFLPAFVLISQIVL